jgi:peroxiredoxin
MVAYETTELGPHIGQNVDEFTLKDWEGKSYCICDMLGEHGLLLGFIGDIWHATSVRRILWLQHHMPRFALMGVPVALLVRDHASTLYGFYISSPLPVPFPMLADEEGTVHATYRMDSHPGLLLLDNEQVLRQKWMMPPDRVWPKAGEIAQAINRISVT